MTTIARVWSLVCNLLLLSHAGIESVDARDITLAQDNIEDVAASAIRSGRTDFGMAESR